VACDANTTYNDSTTMVTMHAICVFVMAQWLTMTKVEDVYGIWWVVAMHEVYMPFQWYNDRV